MDDLIEDAIAFLKLTMPQHSITLENMRYRQFTRNQMIASFLNGYGYMERRGKGVLHMLRLCEEHGIVCTFSLTPDNNEFVVTYSIEGIELSDEFLIADTLSEEAIIGAATMQKWRLKLDFEQDRVLVDQMVTRLMLK